MQLYLCVWFVLSPGLPEKSISSTLDVDSRGQIFSMDFRRQWDRFPRAR
jgi:hypothetical protein